MTNSRCWLLLAALALTAAACSDQNAPTDRAHPDGWVLAHGAEGDAAGAAGACQVCHGADLGGGTAGVACRDCHLEGPPFRVHPAGWTSAVIGHLGFATEFSWTGCATAACHGSDLRGGEAPTATGPSCFTADALGCHGNGPPPPGSHRGVFFTDPALHGPAARGRTLGTGALDPESTQVYCRNCHGRPQNDFEGGFVADPAILDAGAACASAVCHPAARAHPTNWQGSNDTGPYLSSHRGVPAAAVASACALCHRTEAPGAGPLPGAPSCFAGDFTNAAGSFSGCHASGPGSAPHALPFAAPALHGPEARNDQAFCQTCHGTPGSTAFAGGVSAVACSQAQCHPAAGAHPTRWQGNNDVTPDYLASHQAIELATVAVSCAICHRTDAPGAGPNPGAPSCFSTNFTNSDGSPSGCHAAGPGTPSHALPYANSADHGPAAKQDLGFCQTCHGTPRTTGFAGGFTGLACSLCHPEARAHPADWQGTNDASPAYLSTHRNAGALDTACAICHNVAADAPGPDPNAPSCFSANFQGLDCHAGGPGAPHDLGAAWLAPAGHGADGKQRLLFCQGCHGTPGTRNFDGGSAATACSPCHPAAKAHPTDWQGTNDTTVDYLASHRTVVNWGVDCALCHDTLDTQTDPTNPGPSCFSLSFTNANGSLTGCHETGPGPGHVLPFISPALHGALAKQDLTFCQHCHADPFDGGPGSNPRFTVPLGTGIVSVNGCEACHLARTAHPVPWAQGRVADHREFGNKELACTLCHGANLRGPGDSPAGVGPSCRTCHLFGFPIATPLAPAPFVNCTSCHGAPPNGVLPTGSDAASGNVRPNREGAHAEHNALPRVTGVCNTCHNTAGTGTSKHYDTAEPADVLFLPTYNAKGTGVTAIRNANGTCSNVSCHGAQQTPPWSTGTLNVNTQCTSCHRSRSSSDQFNSYFSGNHGDHSSESCTACHNTANLAVNHFTSLDTAAMEGPASATIGGGTTEILAGNYNPSTRSCNPTCHGTETW